MSGYQSMFNGSSALGALLRKMQEDRFNLPASVPASAADSSPIRAQVQGPLQAPESLGSDKVVAVKSALPTGAENPTTVGPSATSTPMGQPGGIVPPSTMPVGPSTAPVGLPGISNPPSSFSPAGVRMPGSGNNQPAPQAGGQVQGASTRAATTTKTSQPMYQSSPFNKTSSPSPSPAPKASNLVLQAGLASQLLPSAMKAMSSVGNSLTNLRGMLTAPFITSKTILDKIKYGIGSSKPQKS